MSTRTPCIGVCSTTSLGDAVCRGCKRYAFEVIDWNSYDDTAKSSVLDRIEKLVIQILENRFHIFSEARLRLGLERAGIPYDLALSPYCWLHNLLRKYHERIANLRDYGAHALPEYSHLPLGQLSEQVEEELLILCKAHLDRYYRQPKPDSCSGKA